MASLSPAPGEPAPSVASVRHSLDELRRAGYHEVVTAALAPESQEPFRAAGFADHEHLHVLAHDLGDIPPMPAVGRSLRRARRTDRPAVLEVDHLAFASFWRLDAAGLDDAVDATPVARFRVADGAAAASPNGDGEPSGDRLVGYAVCGRSGATGYLQRLAVHPANQGSGLGTALVVDALGWLRRRGATRALVNTQVVNHRAAALYRRLGFDLMPEGLAVLRLSLGERQ